MNIRPAKSEDLPACAQLDGSYRSDWVWQMEAQARGTETAVTFRTVRLPRAVQVPYDLNEMVLAWDWQHQECFLVATEDATEDGVLVGCLDMRIQPWQRMGWIYHLVVDKRHRRRGIGSALLQAGMEWARQQGLRHLMAEVATKNYPAIQFCQRRGLVFSGYSDLYFASRDIALFFAGSL